MESRIDLGKENQPTHSTTGQSGTASTRARESAEAFKERANEVVDEASKAASKAYDQASHVVGEKYEQAVNYSRSNPGTALLVAFGAGVGIGILVAAGMPSRSRVSRIAEPVVGALSQIALEFIR